MSWFPVAYTEQKEITTGFDFLTYDRNPRTGVFYYHPGQDINKNQGMGANGDLNVPARSLDYGIVTKAIHVADPATATGYGNMVVVQTRFGFVIYAHLNKILVTEGQELKPGDTIGLMGRTGAAATVHLHFEIRTFALVNYLQGIRTDWWNFYPNNRQKDWVRTMYINPHKQCCMAILVKGDVGDKVFILNEKTGAKHHITNEQVFMKGTQAGLWGTWNDITIRPQIEIDNIPEDNAITFTI